MYYTSRICNDHTFRCMILGYLFDVFIVYFQTNPDPKAIEDLMSRTFSFRRSTLEDSDLFSIGSFVEMYPFLRQETQVRQLSNMHVYIRRFLYLKTYTVNRYVQALTQHFMQPLKFILLRLISSIAVQNLIVHVSLCS